MNTSYQSLRMETAWLDVSLRGKIRISGDDRGRFLHAMTTNRIQRLIPGTGCYTCFLNAAGRILADANVFSRPGHFFLDVEPELGGKLYNHLDKFVIAEDVALQNVSAQLGSIAVEGPSAVKAMHALGAPVPDAPFRNEQWGSRLVARVSITGLDGFRIVFPAEEIAELAAQLGNVGVPAADEEVFRIVRLETGKPIYGEDITERFLAPETNQAHAITTCAGDKIPDKRQERCRDYVGGLFAGIRSGGGTGLCLPRACYAGYGVVTWRHPRYGCPTVPYIRGFPGTAGAG